MGDNGTILHSIDGGTSWTPNSPLTTERLNSIKFKDENIGYIAGSNNILLSTTDGGASWESIPFPFPYPTSIDLFSISLTDNDFYVVGVQ